MLEATATGTRYRALAIHVDADADACKRHADMGFEQGWGAALDQLAAMVKESSAAR